MAREWGEKNTLPNFIEQRGLPSKELTPCVVLPMTDGTSEFYQWYILIRCLELNEFITAEIKKRPFSYVGDHLLKLSHKFALST